MRVCTAGRVGPVGLNLVAAIEEHTIEAYSVRLLPRNGVVIRPAGLEASEQIGRVERRGAMLQKMMSIVIKDTHATGRESMDMILSECLNAANEMTRHGGFAPARWVLSRHPRNPATMGDEGECLDVGALQAHADGQTTFGVQSRYRAKAREAFVRWDCGERVRRAALRKAAPVVGSSQVEGSLVLQRYTYK